MDMKICRMFFCLLCLAPFAAFAAEDPPPPAPRVSLFSTSADWEAVTGLRLGQYRVKFRGSSGLIKKGLEVYFLDGFPCYGQTDRTQAWISPAAKTERDVMIVCLYSPEKLYFAWRDAARDADQNATTGILECPVAKGGDLTIDLSKCARGKDWKEYR
jgi:hypothetical protein